jgi:NADPH:quinone reductase-like Zn-dependent oxidoreductase
MTKSMDMKSVAILSKTGAEHVRENPTLSALKICGVDVHAAMIASDRPTLSRRTRGSENKVLVRVRAFSCNYRDLSFIIERALDPGASLSIIGSDFSGDVVAIGAGVTSLSVGDRVIPDSALHSDSGAYARAAPGIPTNKASSEYLLLDEEQLIGLPRGLSYREGAAFTIGAQTAYSMARRGGIRSNDDVLVTAGRSNTALFAIAALKARGARVSVLTTSTGFEKKFIELGAHAVFAPDLTHDQFLSSEPVLEFAAAIGGFAAVIDPYFDIYLSKVLPLLRPRGSYVTCGLFEQHYTALAKMVLPSGMTDYRSAMLMAMRQNHVIHANCLGTREDLENALKDCDAGRTKVPIDSVIRNGDVAKFLDRTYTAQDRFGKVVFEY